MPQPLVLAIEPDLRQAAIVKRIVREQALADVAVVDSLDAAIEAMRTSMPDVLLLSALLSPRDEDELITHLKTLEHAGHLQTHTIPQLASALQPGEARGSRGLLSAFRRKKDREPVSSGCDPELFAAEIRVFLQRAADKRREMQNPNHAAPDMRPSASGAAQSAAAQAEPSSPETPSSSWSSPFEWKPSASSSRSSNPSSLIANPESPIANPESPIANPESRISNPESRIANHDFPIAARESSNAGSEFPIATPEPPAAIHDSLMAHLQPPSGISTVADVSLSVHEEPVVVEAPPVHVPEPVLVSPPVQVSAPLQKPPAPPVQDPAAVAAHPAIKDSRSAIRDKGFGIRDSGLGIRDKRSGMRDAEAGPGTLASWARSENGGPGTQARDDLRALLTSLAVPSAVVSVGYGRGCRIRRVRVPAARDSQESEAVGAGILQKRASAEQRGHSRA